MTPASKLGLLAVRGALLGLRVPRAVSPAGVVPRPEVEWPILVTFDAPVERERCAQAFDADWCDQHDLTLYALPSPGVWMRAELEDEGQPNDAFQALQIAARLPGDGPSRSQESLESLFEQVKSRALGLGALLTEARYPLESAVARAEELWRVRDFFEQRADGCVHVRVVSTPGAVSDEIGDVLSGVGFDERRGGILAWRNPDDCIGFDPILAAAVEPERGLDLWFSVPRVADPFAVLDAMVAVAALVVTTLGGQIVDELGDPLDVIQLRHKVAEMVERISGARLVPGETALSLG